MADKQTERAANIEEALGLTAATFVAKEFIDTFTNGTGPLGKFSEALGGINKAASEFAGISPKFQESIKSVVDAVKSPGKGLESLTNALSKQIKSYQEYRIEISKAGRGTEAKQFIENLRLQQYEVSKLGISLNELKDINKAVLDNYVGATKFTDRQAQSFKDNSLAINELIGFNNKFGVEQSVTIDLLNKYTNIMGGGTKATQKLSDQLIIFSQKTGQNVNKVFEQFNANIDRFSVLTGEKAVASFQKMEMIAKRTGESVDGIIGSISKFDDIESGFEAGGQLNRVLSFMGGSFDTFRAMQADDDERAQMLFQAISGVADQYQNLQTSQAKRAFAKQIEQSTGMNPKTIMSLLNKSTDVSKDLAEIYQKPPATEEFTKQGRERAAMAMTTNDQLKEMQGQLFELNPLVARLSEVTHENAVAFTGFEKKFVEQLDLKFKPYFERGGIKDIPGFAKTLGTEMSKIPSEFTRYMAEFRNQKPITDNVIKNNTVVTDKLNTTLDNLHKNGIKNDVKVKVEFDKKTGNWVAREVESVVNSSFAKGATGNAPTRQATKSGEPR